MTRSRGCAARGSSSRSSCSGASARRRGSRDEWRSSTRKCVLPRHLPPSPAVSHLLPPSHTFPPLVEALGTQVVAMAREASKAETSYAMLDAQRVSEVHQAVETTTVVWTARVRALEPARTFHGLPPIFHGLSPTFHYLPPPSTAFRRPSTAFHRRCARSMPSWPACVRSSRSPRPRAFR